MGTWNIQLEDASNNIPATARKYNSDPYYIGLLKNEELNTTEAISDLTITKSVEWIKDAYIDPQTKSPNGDYYPLTYEVNENTDTSERVGHILIKHNAANKIIEYIITQSANTTQEPTEPTLTVYDFIVIDYTGPQNYPLQVGDYNSESGGSFASIKANDINDSTPLNIDIKIDLLSTNSWDELNFNFTIIGKGFEFDSSIDNAGTTNYKSVNIMFGDERKGFLKVERSDNGGLKIRITIFPNNQNPKALALLSEDIISEDISTSVLSENITGKITIKNSTHNIKFKVTLGFGALQQ